MFHAKGAFAAGAPVDVMLKVVAPIAVGYQLRAALVALVGVMVMCWAVVVLASILFGMGF